MDGWYERSTPAPHCYACAVASDADDAGDFVSVVDTRPADLPLPPQPPDPRPGEAV